MKITSKVTHEITDERISHLLCAGLEGGMSGWLQDIDYQLAEGVRFEDIRRDPEADDYLHWTQLVPLHEGCKLVAVDAYDNDELLEMDRESIDRALQLMADRYPKQFQDFIDENEDALTGDLFLQLCFLGEVMYG